MKFAPSFLALLLAVTSTASAIAPSKADLLRHDKNGDGSLSAAELKQLTVEEQNAARDAYDRNSDQAISAKELEAGPIDHEKAKPTDKDKKKQPRNRRPRRPRTNKAPNHGKGGGGGAARPTPSLRPVK